MSNFRVQVLASVVATLVLVLFVLVNQALAVAGTTSQEGVIDCHGKVELYVRSNSSEVVTVQWYGRTFEMPPYAELTIHDQRLPLTPTSALPERLTRKRPDQVFHTSRTSVISWTSPSFAECARLLFPNPTLTTAIEGLVHP